MTSMQGSLPTGGGGVAVPPGTRKSGGTHPTGMLSWLLLSSVTYR